MIVGVARETHAGERRVALVPPALPPLVKAELEVQIESGAGVESGWPDAAYAERGAKLVPRDQVFGAADVLLAVRAPDPGVVRRGQTLVGMLDPLGAPAAVQALAATGVTAFALELLPRITRAQSMDVLSSMATVAGYKAVLLAAAMHPRMFPMLTTAAGTITPARVFVIGAGVAGLQAIATARRLGAVVEAYDVRPAVKDQIQSLGAKFLELPLETGGAEGAGGYAKAQDEAFYDKQRQLMGKAVQQCDVVVCTAAIPGKRSPVLVTAEMVRRMAPGSIIVDLAAERGGNCELTRADETVVDSGVTILGPTNLASAAPYHASQMYAKNVSTFLLHLVKEGRLQVDLEDEITRETLVVRDGEVVHPRLREALGLGSPAAAAGRGA